MAPISYEINSKLFSKILEIAAKGDPELFFYFCHLPLVLTHVMIEEHGSTHPSAFYKFYF